MRGSNRRLGQWLDRGRRVEYAERILEDRIHFEHARTLVRVTVNGSTVGMHLDFSPNSLTQRDRYGEFGVLRQSFQGPAHAVQILVVRPEVNAQRWRRIAEASFIKADGVWRYHQPHLLSVVTVSSE